MEWKFWHSQAIAALLGPAHIPVFADNRWDEPSEKSAPPRASGCEGKKISAALVLAVLFAASSRVFADDADAGAPDAAAIAGAPMPVEKADEIKGQEKPTIVEAQPESASNPNEIHGEYAYRIKPTMTPAQRKRMQELVKKYLRGYQKLGTEPPAESYKSFRPKPTKAPKPTDQEALRKAANGTGAAEGVIDGTKKTQTGAVDVVESEPIQDPHKP